LIIHLHCILIKIRGLKFYDRTIEEFNCYFAKILKFLMFNNYFKPNLKATHIN